MARGGLRAGAGRKSVLTDMERMLLGADCESRFNRFAAAKLEAAVASAINQRTEYDAMIDEVRSVPIDDREEWLTTEAASYHRDDVEGIMRTQHGLPDDYDGPVSRGIHVQVTKPYGVRKTIVWEVAKAAADTWGRPVSPRLVRECWDEFRKNV